MDALKESIADVTRRKKAVDATYLKVQQNFTWENTVEDVIKVFEENNKTL